MPTNGRSAAQERALAELRRVAAALAEAGGSATVDAVARAAGLTRREAQRRLVSGGGGAPGKVVRYFSIGGDAVPPPPPGGRVWYLTPDGWSLVREGAADAD